MEITTTTAVMEIIEISSATATGISTGTTETSEEISVVEAIETIMDETVFKTTMATPSGSSHRLTPLFLRSNC
jgi:hypothetical protein